MSDFDKEAEREKLREKYEKEERKREATEQMSELLLKGATMTNAHCSDCGDPIFRYDGQEFCPTCEKPVDRSGDDAAAEETNGASGEGNVEVTSPSDDARVRFGNQGDDVADEPTGEPADATAEETTETPQPPERETGEQAAEPTRSAPSLEPSDSTMDDQSRSNRQPATGSSSNPATSDVGSSIASARASLARTAARFATAAENTDDPTVAREHLEAAREAAAALDELD